MIYRLIVLSGPLQGRRITIDQAPMTMGRSATCSIPIEDEEMAQQHAVVEHRPDGLRIRDLGTMNRILVNGREVRESRLRHGDEVELGRTRFLVQAVVQAEVDATGPKRLTPRVRRFVRDLVVALVIIAAVVTVRNRWHSGGTDDAAEDVDIALPPLVTEPAIQPSTPPDEGPLWDPGPAEVPAPAQPQPVVTTPTQPTQPAVIVPATTTIPVPAVTTTTSPSVTTTTRPAPVVDPVVERSKKTLDDARRKIAVGDYVQADSMLDAISVFAPDYLPAYAERASLYERRDMPERALEQWMEIIERGAGTPLYAEAVREFDRIKAKIPPPPPPERNRIRIASLDQYKFPESDEYREMRVVEVVISPVRAGDTPNPSAVQVDVDFYDENPSSGTIQPTRASVTLSPLTPERDWRPGEPKTVRATYTVPKRSDGTSSDPRGAFRYYGSVVRVRYRNTLQEQDARPKALLQGLSQPQAGSSGAGGR